MSTLRGMPLKMIGYTVSSYELEYSNDGYIYEFTTGYDLFFHNHTVMAISDGEQKCRPGAHPKHS